MTEHLDIDVNTFAPEVCHHCGLIWNAPAWAAALHLPSVDEITQADLLQILAGMRQARERLDDEQYRAVKLLREVYRVPWSVIGEQLGVSKTTAMRKHQERQDPDEVES